MSFTQVNRKGLGFDLAKLQWNAESRGEANDAEHKRLRDSIEECGVNRVILCRCDNKQAVEFGQALGISLFQGRYLDSVVDPEAKVVN